MLGFATKNQHQVPSILRKLLNRTSRTTHFLQLTPDRLPQPNSLLRLWHSSQDDLFRLTRNQFDIRILVAIRKKIMVFWDVTPCSTVINTNVPEHAAATGSTLYMETCSYEILIRKEMFPKRRLTFGELHSVISQRQLDSFFHLFNVWVKVKK
jgi:hypothetical protein